MSGKIMAWAERNRRKIQIAGLAMAFATSLSFVFFREVMVQDGARVDSDDIIAMVRGEVPMLDDHYEMAGKAYQLFGVIDSPWVVGIVAVCLMSGVILWLNRGKKRVAWGVWGIEMVAILLTGYYLGALSKDLFELIIVTFGSLLLLKLVKNKFVVVGGMAVLMLGFAGFIRPYWAVIAGLFVGTTIVLCLLQKQRLWAMAGIAGMAIVGAVVGYWILKGEDISVIRQMINSTTNLADTRLWGVLPSGNVFSGVVNSLLIFLGFFVPVRLFLLGSGFYFLAGVCFMVLFGYFFAWLWRTREQKFDYKLTAVLALLVAYLVVSSLFEPDYSSFLRHLTPMLPFMVFCFNYDLPKRLGDEKGQ